MHVAIQSLGNEGFLIATPSARVYVDAFFDSLPWMPRPVVRPRDAAPADLILVTHAHWDHFSARAVAEAAKRSGAVVVGPADVVRALAGRVPAERLAALEPPSARGGAPASAQAATFPAAVVTALRTFHGRRHNSYLVDLGGWRFLHDGDNEDTRRIDRAALGRLDALLIGPWQGSGWPEFIEAAAARHTLLMHLTDEELAEHRAGTFLPSLCDRPPAGLVALAPGETFAIDNGPRGSGGDAGTGRNASA